MDLQLQLNQLREQFKREWGTDSSKWPKNDLDRRWWKFKCDKAKGQEIKRQIEKIKAGKEILATDLTDEQTKEIFK